MTLPNYYYILGLDFSASDLEVKTSYRKLSKKFHPDMNDGDKFFEQRFKEIQTAYETLIDPAKKEAYLRSFKQQSKEENQDSAFAYKEQNDSFAKNN